MVTDVRLLFLNRGDLVRMGATPRVRRESTVAELGVLTVSGFGWLSAWPSPAHKVRLCLLGSSADIEFVRDQLT